VSLLEKKKKKVDTSEFPRDYKQEKNVLIRALEFWVFFVGVGCFLLGVWEKRVGFVVRFGERRQRITYVVGLYRCVGPRRQDEDGGKKNGRTA